MLSGSLSAQPIELGAKTDDFFFETRAGFGFFVLPLFGMLASGRFFVLFLFGETFVVFGFRAGAAFFGEFLFEPQFVFDGRGQDVFARAIPGEAQLRAVGFIRNDDPIQAEGLALKQGAAAFAFDEAVFDAVPDGDRVLGCGIETDDFTHAAVLVAGKLVGPNGGAAVGVAYDFNDEVGISAFPNVPGVEIPGVRVDLNKHVRGKTLFGVGGIVIDELFGADGDVSTFPTSLGHDFVGLAKHQVQRGASFQVALAFRHAFLEGFLFAKFTRITHDEVLGRHQRRRHRFGGFRGCRRH